VVGTGLLGTSIALGLRAGGTRVVLHDPSPTALALAGDLGAGTPDDGLETVDLVVVAAPPDVTATVVAAELRSRPDAVVTDVASVKAGIIRELRAAGADLTRYVGGHPMAGAERSGPVAARGDLFLGRPWVVCPPAGAPVGAVDRVRGLALALGAAPVTMDVDQHDAAVALVSHVPQVAASLVAARLNHGTDAAVALAGQGLRDVTRVAASDPLLWVQILAANPGPVRTLLAGLRADLDAVLRALDDLDVAGSGTPVLTDALRAERRGGAAQDVSAGTAGAVEEAAGFVGEAAGAVGEAAEAVPGAARSVEGIGPRAVLARLISAGNTGRERIPGKHGAPPAVYAVVTVLIPDTPGQLGQLFADIGEVGVNVEEFSLEHAPGQQVGLAGISVLPAARATLEQALAERGWRVVA